MYELVLSSFIQFVSVSVVVIRCDGCTTLVSGVFIHFGPKEHWTVFCWDRESKPLTASHEKKLDQKLKIQKSDVDILTKQQKTVGREEKLASFHSKPTSKA